MAKATRPKRSPTTTAICAACGYRWERRVGALPRGQCPSCHKNLELGKATCRRGQPHLPGDTLITPVGPMQSEGPTIWDALREGKELVLLCETCDAPIAVRLGISPPRTTPALEAAR